MPPLRFIPIAVSLGRFFQFSECDCLVEARQDGFWLANLGVWRNQLDYRIPIESLTGSF